MSNKSRIINKAKDLVLKYGVRSVTMDELSSKLGISKKTLYQEIEDKKTLIDEIIEQMIKEHKETISAIHEDSSNAIDEMLQIAEYVVSLLKNMAPFVVYDLQKYYNLTWQKVEEFHQTFIFSCIKGNLERGILEGYYRNTINKDIIAKLYIGKSMLIADESLFPSMEFNREALFREFIMYHLNGILSQEGINYLTQKNKLISVS